ncbi:MAG TPA: glycoside hydrolase family 32 protein [Puia sp.]|jgi:fructan beta-fructosidase|nr:glycoside hydrolase family 32 protein [Puia sp.]
MKNIGLVFGLMLVAAVGLAQQPGQPQVYHERWRPQFHFSPKAHWMNDPNGMVYYGGTFHLFFQYYPDSMVWGPMHWGHAVSRDMVYWQELPIALYPDKLGYIFSGSAVVDTKNVTGFGTGGALPIVAIYTQHDPVGASQNRNDFQNQSIAYSLDSGGTWVKYSGNPVLRNPGITDFRDPKVIWDVAEQKWIMVLAVKDHVEFYSSKDLKGWNKVGEFGKDKGARGGVWECPDLFPINDDQGHSTWVLIVNINPGGPNGGSATQYFLGNFDGRSFTAKTPGTRWLDYGPDEYAGVTWSNTGARRIFLGWMSNWLYGQRVPTDPWRSANTLPRDLQLARVGDSLYVTSTPVWVLDELETRRERVTPPAALPKLAKISLQTNKTAAFNLVFSNAAGDSTVIGYDGAGRYFIDRRHAGVSVGPDFDRIYWAPRVSRDSTIGLTIYADASSFELFADGGLTVMTALVFPSKPYDRVALRSMDGVAAGLSISTLKSIHN